ncbi:MAG: polysaccharide deacetylase family protein [Flavobacteriales bacterium]
METTEKVVYLTFDDGPVPEVTPLVLDLLNDFNAKASFFCVGDNARMYPEILNRIVENGHCVGNHTQNHLNGWGTSTFSYFRNYLDCSKWVDSRLFRPPYGRITKKQLSGIKVRSKVIMWDVLSGDFDQKISVEKCVENVLSNVQPGSIVVFHDSIKAKSNVLGALPEILKDLKLQGYEFKSLKEIQ